MIFAFVYFSTSSGFHCIDIKWNSFLLWNCRRVVWTRKGHRRVEKGEIWVNYPFNNMWHIPLRSLLLVWCYHEFMYWVFHGFPFFRHVRPHLFTFFPPPSPSSTSALPSPLNSVPASSLSSRLKTFPPQVCFCGFHLSICLIVSVSRPCGMSQQTPPLPIMPLSKRGLPSALQSAHCGTSKTDRLSRAKTKARSIKST